MIRKALIKETLITSSTAFILDFLLGGMILEILSLQFFLSLGTIILMDISLGGDNAMVIAMASNRLPAAERKKAVFIGAFGAAALRILFTFFAVWLMTIPYLQVLGGFLLIPVAVHLLSATDDNLQIKAADNLWTAIKTIILADFLMSLDNILSVAGAAEGNFLLVMLGLMISIPLVVMGSQLVGKILDRFPLFMYAGAALIGWTAGTMFLHDKALGPVLLSLAGNWLETALPSFLAFFVCVLGRVLSRRKK